MVKQTRKSFLIVPTTKNRVKYSQFTIKQIHYNFFLNVQKTHKSNYGSAIHVKGTEFDIFVNNIALLNSIKTFIKSSKTYFGCLLDYAIPNLIRE